MKYHNMNNLIEKDWFSYTHVKMFSQDHTESCEKQSTPGDSADVEPPLAANYFFHSFC